MSVLYVCSVGMIPSSIINLKKKIQQLNIEKNQFTGDTLRTSCILKLRIFKY